MTFSLSLKIISKLSVWKIPHPDYKKKISGSKCNDLNRILRPDYGKNHQLGTQLQNTRRPVLAQALPSGSGCFYRQ